MCVCEQDEWGHAEIITVEAIQIQYEISIVDNYILWACDKLVALMNPVGTVK